MRKADRLFEIIEMLRTRGGVVTAAELSSELGVSERTIYRDIAGLQGQGVPVEGEAGIGYVLRPGFHMPPLMFTEEELEAIVLGARFAARQGDPSLARAAQQVVAKVKAVVPDRLRDKVDRIALFAAHGSSPDHGELDMALVRDCIRTERKVTIDYVDLRDRVTERTIWPVAVAFFSESTLLAAWCELRNDFRHFRTDRVKAIRPTGDKFSGGGGRLLKAWEAKVTGQQHH